MSWSGWWSRLDARNQARMNGLLRHPRGDTLPVRRFPRPSRLTLRSLGDDWVVHSERGMMTGGATFIDEGLTCRVWGRNRLVSWADVAAVSWDSDRSVYWLCACLYGRATPQPMDAASIDLVEVRSLLADVRPIVERHGSSVVDDVDAALYWWPLDQRSSSRRDRQTISCRAWPLATWLRQVWRKLRATTLARSATPNEQCPIPKPEDRG